MRRSLTTYGRATFTSPARGGYWNRVSATELCHSSSLYSTAYSAASLSPRLRPFNARSYCTKDQDEESALPEETPTTNNATGTTEKPKKKPNYAAAKVMRRPRGWWNDINNQRAYLDNLSKEFGIKQLADWYNITKWEVLEKGGKGLFTQYPSLGYALKSVYPHFPWQIPRFIDNMRPSKWVH